MRMWKNWIVLAGLAGLATGWLNNTLGAAADSLVVLENPLLVVKSPEGAATGCLYLVNTSDVPVKVRLSATDFTNIATGLSLGASVRFEVGGQWLPFLETNGLASQGTLAVRIEATNVWEAGESVASLLADGAPLTPLLAARWETPFAVSVAGAASPTNELVCESGWPVALVLSNADPMTYQVRWDLMVAGQPVANGNAVLPPESQVTAGTAAGQKVFRGGLWSRFKDQLQDAQLVLWWDPPARTSTWAPREKIIPVRFRSPGSVPAQYVMIFALLLLGVAGSWALHITLPNLRRRADLGSQLDHLAERTRNLSSHISSSLRVVLRVQRKRLLADLRSGWVWSPDTSNTLDEVKTGIATLSQQLALVERMDRVYDRVTGGGDTLVPLSLHEAIHATLASVTGALLATSPTDGDLQAAETLLKDAEGRLSHLGQADAVLAPQIAGRIKTVRAQLTGALLEGGDGTRVSNRLRTMMAPPLFKPEYEDAKNITPDLYLQLDAISCKLELVAKYLRLLGGLDEPSKRAAPLEREERFLQYLGLDGYAVFQLADRLLLEMRQGVYPEDIQARLPSGKERTEPGYGSHHRSRSAYDLPERSRPISVGFSPAGPGHRGGPRRVQL